MTTREFLNSIVSANISEELTDYAKDALAKLDARNAKRAATPSKTAIANAPVKEAIVAFLGEQDGAHVTAEIATGVGVSTQKASSLLTQLVEEGKIAKSEVKLPKVGKRMAYSVK